MKTFPAYQVAKFSKRAHLVFKQQFYVYYVSLKIKDPSQPIKHYSHRVVRELFQTGCRTTSCKNFFFYHSIFSI